jgi:hypothetical protein
MFNVKWGIVSGGAAFALAFVMSLLIGHTGLPVALLRALVFAVVFFGLGLGIWVLISTFIPELLSSGAEDEGAGNVLFGAAAGSRVNITVDDAPNTALPAALPGTEHSENEDVGDFTDLVSGSISAGQDIDQSPATSYTGDEETEVVAPALDKVKVEGLGDLSMDFGAFVSDDLSGDEMANLDVGADTFSFLPGSGSAKKPQETSTPERKVSGNKAATLQGDFDPKEIAAGIQTVLKRDKG